MQIGEEQAKQKAAELAVKQAEHNRKKKEATLARKKKKEAEQPEIIEVSGTVKTTAVPKAVVVQQDEPEATEENNTDAQP